MAAETATSIYDLPPIETGGSRNREGLAFQDHVATGFCLQMLEDPQLEEVWCETQDDVTLLWRLDSGITVEFVQVKSDQLDQLWSVSELCTREEKKAGTSILERSLSYDRCKEATFFRIVTARPFKAELALLTHPRDAALRTNDAAGLIRIQDSLSTKVGDWKSANGRTCREWAERALLDTRHCESAVRDANILKLRALLEKRGFPTLHEQTEEIYMRIVSKIAEASQIDARLNPSAKRFHREGFEALVMKIASSYLQPPVLGGGQLLQEKLENAGVPADAISQAQIQRRSYRARSLVPRYLETKDRVLFDEEIAALLHELKARLDSGEIPDDGRHFHALCLRELVRFRDSLPQNNRPAVADLQGCMYNVTDRCLHRFRRASA